MRSYINKTIRGRGTNEAACEMIHILERENYVMQKVNSFFAGHAGRILCLSCCVVLFLIAAGVFSDSVADESEKAVAPKTDQMQSETRSKVKPEWKMPEHYPIDGFDGMGQVDRISVSDGEIVINDRRYLISADTAYSTPTDINASRFLFRAGMNVGYILASDYKISSVWLIEIKRR